MSHSAATVAGLHPTAQWWRRQPPAKAAVVARPGEQTGDSVAFGALVTFTIILLVSPQAWFPAIKSLRLALLAAGVAIVAHLCSRAFGGQRAAPLRREMVIALGLILWAAITIPMSIWPGGSWAQLTDHLVKAVVFFWLIATLVSTRSRLELFAWVLALCSIPLAVTALDNYRSGVFVTHASSAVQRIAGYVGGSGLAGNPNDLALMLNLMMPITGALLLITERPWLRVVAGGALLLSVAAVIATFSRAGFLTLAVIAAMSLVAMARRRAAGTALLVVFLAVGGLFVMPEGYLARLSTITNIEADVTGSAQGRWTDYLVSLDYIRQHPITGAGLGQDLLALNEARGIATWRSVHNAFLQAAVDLGLPGFLLLLALLFASLGNARLVRKQSSRQPGLEPLALLAQGVQMSLVAFTVAAFFHPIAYQFYFFCLAGLAVALGNAYRAEVAPAP